MPKTLKKTFNIAAVSIGGAGLAAATVLGYAGLLPDSRSCLDICFDLGPLFLEAAAVIGGLSALSLGAGLYGLKKGAAVPPPAPDAP